MAQRLRDDLAKRAKPGALRDRKVMTTRRERGQGAHAIMLEATGAVAPNPQRYGPNPFASTETVRMPVFGGTTRVLDYRFGF